MLSEHVCNSLIKLCTITRGTGPFLAIPLSRHFFLQDIIFILTMIYYEIFNTARGRGRGVIPSFSDRVNLKENLIHERPSSLITFKLT